jgi:hypothetical protein
VQQRRPQQYARLHAWLVVERSKDELPGSHHDTLAWIGEPALAGAGTIFAVAQAAWVGALRTAAAAR